MTPNGWGHRGGGLVRTLCEPVPTPGESRGGERGRGGVGVYPGQSGFTASSARWQPVGVGLWSLDQERPRPLTSTRQTPLGGFDGSSKSGQTKRHHVGGTACLNRGGTARGMCGRIAQALLQISPRPAFSACANLASPRCRAGRRSGHPPRSPSRRARWYRRSDVLDISCLPVGLGYGEGCRTPTRGV